MFALGALHHRTGDWTKHLQTGEKITKTCYKSYAGTVTGLGAEIVDGGTLGVRESGYHLRPEAVESIFYMWRFTHDKVYRDMGWTIAQVSKLKVGRWGLSHLNNYFRVSKNTPESGLDTVI